MARKRNRREQRDDTTIATDSLSELVLRPVNVLPLVDPTEGMDILREVEDRRLWAPVDYSAPRLTSGGESSLEIRRTSRPVLPNTLQFSNPQHVAVCVRRHQRRQVLFAKKRTRKGAGARRRRSRWSRIGC